jgi:hypothetical protein
MALLSMTVSLVKILILLSLVGLGRPIQIV